MGSPPPEWATAVFSHPECAGQTFAASLWNPVHLPSVRCSFRQERTSKKRTAGCGEATESIVIPMLDSPSSKSVYPCYRSQVRIHATWHRKRNAKVSPRSFRTDTAGVHCSWHSSVIGKRISVLGPCRTNTISSDQKTFATTPGKRRERRSSGYCGSSESLNTMPWQV